MEMVVKLFVLLHPDMMTAESKHLNTVRTSTMQDICKTWENIIFDAASLIPGIQESGSKIQGSKIAGELLRELLDP